MFHADLAAGLQGAVVKDERRRTNSSGTRIPVRHSSRNAKGPTGASLYNALRASTSMSNSWNIHVFGVRHLSPGGAWHLRPVPRPRAPQGRAHRGADRRRRARTRYHAQGHEAARRHSLLTPTRCRCARSSIRWRATAPNTRLCAGRRNTTPALSSSTCPRTSFSACKTWKRNATPAAPIPPTPPFLPLRSGNPNGPDPFTKRSQSGPAGPKRYDTYWERHFEHNLSEDAYRLAAFELGRVLRDEEDPPRWRAENLVREAFMRRRIEEVIADGVRPEQIVAVRR